MSKLLDQIEYPADLRKLNRDQLEKVSEELREELIDVVSETGGHLGAGLGVVELTSLMPPPAPLPPLSTAALRR